jgi:hypothetical protein
MNLASVLDTQACDPKFIFVDVGVADAIDVTRMQIVVEAELCALIVSETEGPKKSWPTRFAPVETMASIMLDRILSKMIPFCPAEIRLPARVRMMP